MCLLQGRDRLRVLILLVWCSDACVVLVLSVEAKASEIVMLMLALISKKSGVDLMVILCWAAGFEFVWIWEASGTYLDVCSKAT